MLIDPYWFIDFIKNNFCMEEFSEKQTYADHCNSGQLRAQWHILSTPWTHSAHTLRTIWAQSGHNLGTQIIIILMAERTHVPRYAIPIFLYSRNTREILHLRKPRRSRLCSTYCAWGGFPRAQVGLDRQAWSNMTGTQRKVCVCLYSPFQHFA